MSQFTPGPWVVRETRDGMTIRKYRKRLEVVAPCPGGGEMVIVGKQTGLDCLRSANARLISAAPSLYAAAKRLLNPVPGETLDEVITALKEAVEQAEGREGK